MQRRRWANRMRWRAGESKSGNRELVDGKRDPAARRMAELEAHIVTSGPRKQA